MRREGTGWGRAGGMIPGAGHLLVLDPGGATGEFTQIPYVVRACFASFSECVISHDKKKKKG